MKYINQTQRLQTKPLSYTISAILAASSLLSVQAMAEESQTLPVKEVPSFQNLDYEVETLPEGATIESLSGLKTEETVSVINEDGKLTKETKVIESTVDINTPKPETVSQPQTPPSQVTSPTVAKPKKDTNKPVVTETPKPVTQPISKPEVTPPESETSPVTVDTKPNKTADDTIKSITEKDGKIYKTVNLSNYAKQVNAATWSKGMKKNTAMTVKLQALLDWNHASPGPIDGGWGMNSVKALTNFQAMSGLPKTGKMDEATWAALTKNIPANQPVLMTYKLRSEDTNYKFTQLPSGYEAKSKLKALNYQDIYEKLAEEYHMDVKYLKKLNKGKKFKTGETITVYNPGGSLNARITKVVANKADKTLYAYNGKSLVATYPTTVGSAATPSPHGTFKIANRVKKPHYKATVGEGKDKKVFMLKPGPNSPVGIVWMGLSKPTYGIHGSPLPEGISRQQSHGCIRLTNWDALEVRKNIRVGATVVLE